jgi:DNA-binding HxlR family transcriptional regulator
MYDYGEACPMSKATSLLCERWTLQIVREMFLGASRFSEFQKFLPRISPSLLNTRLRHLVESGIAIKKRSPEKRGFEYRLTPAGKALAPLLTELGAWGRQWVYDVLGEVQYNVEAAVRSVAELIDVNQLPDGETVIQFTFTDIDDCPKWFITVKDGKCEHCDINMGYEVDVYIRTSLATLSEIWWGQKRIAAAMERGELKVSGPTVYTKSLSSWFPSHGLSGCHPQGGNAPA